MEENMKNERENRKLFKGRFFSDDFWNSNAILFWGKLGEMLHTPWEIIIQIWLQTDFLIWYWKETTDDVPVECLYVKC